MKSGITFEIGGMADDTDTTADGEYGHAGLAILMAVGAAIQSHPVLAARLAAGDITMTSSGAWHFALSPGMFPVPEG